MKCQVCNNEIVYGSKFCPYCGNDLSKIKSQRETDNYSFCPNCNNKVEKDEAFCGSCGYNLKEAQQKAEELRCPKCQSKIEEREKFCKTCGYDIAGLHNKTQSNIQESASSEFIKEKAKPQKYIFVIFFTVIALIVAGYFIFIWMPAHKEKELWQHAVNNSTLSSYSTYILKYPNGKYYYEAEREYDMLISDSLNLIKIKEENERKRIEAIERGKRKNELNRIYNNLQQYYKSVENGTFDANNFFTYNVDQYYSYSDVTPDIINDFYRNKFLPEFKESSFDIDFASVNIQEINNSTRVVFKGVFRCYRKSKHKYQRSESEVTIIYNENLLITSIFENAVKNIEFSSVSLSSDNSQTEFNKNIGIVNSDKVNVRVEAGTNYAIVYQVNTGDKVYILGSKEILVNGEAILNSKVNYTYKGYTNYLNKGKSVKVISRNGDMIKISAKINENKSVFLNVDKNILDISNLQTWLNISFNDKIGYTLDRFVTLNNY